MNRKEMLACLTDRPCAVCKYHSDNGCTQWKCVFEQETCEDAISRSEAIRVASGYCHPSNIAKELAKLPSVTQKTGWCKDCKYFEYDSVTNVDGIPLIVAHEICSRWGDGCKTREDGFCFLFEAKMEVEE